MHTGLSLRVFTASPKFQCFETRFGYCCPDLGLAYKRRHIINAGMLAGKADLCFQNTFDLEERLFQAACIVVVSQTPECEVGLSGRDSITGAAYPGDHVVQSCNGRIELHGRSFRREVDHRTLHALYLLQIALDGRHAICTVHAGNR